MDHDSVAATADPRGSAPDASTVDAVMDAVRDFFGGPPTNQRFEEVLERHPVLLTRAGLDAVGHIGAHHPDAQARETMSRLHGMLVRVGEVGVEKAMAESRVEVSAEELRTARLAEEGARLREQRLKADPKAPEGPSDAMLAKGPKFDSLEECLRHIIETYPQGALDVRSRDISSKSDDDPLTAGTMPAFLFRGESGIYPSTQTSMTRLSGDRSMSAETLQTLTALSDEVRDRLGAALGLSAREAGGLLQHYGAPTSLFDVSPNLDVAVEFATNLAVGDWGTIAVLPVSALMDDPDGFMLADIRGHRLASRPRRQDAFVYYDDRYDDLKDAEALTHRQIVWHWFKFTADDEAAHLPNPSRLDVRSDPVAGLLQVFINDLAPFDAAAARWLADRIPAAPFVMRVLEQVDDHLNFAILAADDAAAEIFESSPETNYARWSEGLGLTAEFVVGPGGVNPGELVWALRGSALAHARLPG